MTRLVRIPTYAAAAGAMVAFVVSACSEAAEPAVAVTDSAGVEIVTNLDGSMESADRWTLSVEPAVSIGAGTDPEVALYRVTAVAALPAGGVVVGMNTPPQALVFERGGRLVARLGRQGQGPGEFSSVGSVVPLTDDSVAVWDPDRRRISVFTIAGDFVREVDLSELAPVSTRAAPDTRSNSGITHLLRSTPGTLVVFGEGATSSDPERGINRATLPAFRVSGAGEEIASFGSIPGMEWHHGGPAGALPLPFGARTYGATAGDMFVVGTAEATEVRVFGPEGDLTRIVRWPDADRVVGGEYLSRWSAMVDSAPPSIRQLVEAMPRREQYPAFEGMVTSELGNLWIGEYAGPVGIWPLRRADHGPEMLQPQLRTPSRRWLVFTSDGVLEARVQTPEGFEPYSVDGDHVWGVYSDSLGVESIRAYAITRS